MISVLELQKADVMLMQFCQKFEQLYGTSKVKPNMHLHGHLKECVLDYGPIYNFWCFSFERFNGILSSFKTNNRCIEIQLTRKLLSDHFISSASLPAEFGDHFLPILSRHLKNSAESVTDMVKLGPKLINAALSSNLLDIDWKMLGRKCAFHAFTGLELWIPMTSLPFLLCTSPCMAKELQALIVWQTLCDGLGVSLLVQRNLAPSLTVYL